MNPTPADIVVLDVPDSETVAATSGAWESPVGEGYTRAQAIRALEELRERAPECYHCGPVQSVEEVDGERYGCTFENRMLCADCRAFYETDSDVTLGEDSRSHRRKPVDERREMNHSLAEREWV